MTGLKVRFAVAPARAGTFGDGGFAGFVEGLERRGFDTVWLSDLPASVGIDPLLGIAFAAARTTKLKLGMNIIPFAHSPAVLARELAQLDRLSDGRLLIQIVPGIGRPVEREILGIGRADRGALIDEIVPLLRAFWSGDEVTHRGRRFVFEGVRVQPPPHQQPLEIWLGGMGPKALERAGRLADGWLGAALLPPEAAEARALIDEAAGAAGRTIDPQHFGMSIAYAHGPLGPEYLAAVAARRPDLEDPSALFPVGPGQISEAVGRYVEAGLSKFVLSCATPVDDWDEELGWLADCVLPLQT